MSEQITSLETKIDSFKKSFEDFMTEYNELVSKQKKTAAHKARKNLLSIRKVAQELRKDIMAVVKSMPKKSKGDVAEPVVTPEVATPEVAPDAQNA